jgi:hypothetical protein
LQQAKLAAQGQSRVFGPIAIVNGRYHA